MFTEIKYTTIMEGRKFTSPLPTGRQAKSLSSRRGIFKPFSFEKGLGMSVRTPLLGDCFDRILSLREKTVSQ